MRRSQADHYEGDEGRSCSQPGERDVATAADLAAGSLVELKTGLPPLKRRLEDLGHRRARAFRQGRAGVAHGRPAVRQCLWGLCLPGAAGADPGGRSGARDSVNRATQ